MVQRARHASLTDFPAAPFLGDSSAHSRRHRPQGELGRGRRAGNSEALPRSSTPVMGKACAGS